MGKADWIRIFIAESQRLISAEISEIRHLGAALWPFFGTMDPGLTARTEWCGNWPEACLDRWRADGAMARAEGVSRDRNPLQFLMTTPVISGLPVDVWPARLAAWAEGWDIGAVSSDCSLD